MCIRGGSDAVLVGGAGMVAKFARGALGRLPQEPATLPEVQLFVAASTPELSPVSKHPRLHRKPLSSATLDQIALYCQQR